MRDPLAPDEKLERIPGRASSVEWGQMGRRLRAKLLEVLSDGALLEERESLQVTDVRDAARIQVSFREQPPVVRNVERGPP